MSDEDAFLAAIAANPHDRVARLVYADWLDERCDEAATAKASRIRAEAAEMERREREEMAREEARQEKILDDLLDGLVGRMELLLTDHPDWVRPESKRKYEEDFRNPR